MPHPIRPSWKKIEQQQKLGQDRSVQFDVQIPKTELKTKQKSRKRTVEIEKRE